VPPSGERAKNVLSISLTSLRQHYLVAMATSLDKLENKVQIHHRHGEKVRKSVQSNRRYSTKYAEPRREHAMQFRLEFSTKTTGPIITKILHDIVALVVLFNHAYTRHYPIPFLNARAISAMG